MELDIKLSLPLCADQSSLCKLATEAIRFLLFQRQQIPSPVQILERNCAKDKKSVHQPKVKLNSVQTRQKAQFERQVSKFLGDLTRLEQSLQEVFDNGEVEELHILIGPTPISAKEIHKIDFSNFASDGDASTVSAQVLKLCCRKLCMELVQLSDLFIDSTAPSCVHVFVKSRKGTKPTGWLPWTQYKMNRKKLQLDLCFFPDQNSSRCSENNKENLSTITGRDKRVHQERTALLHGPSAKPLKQGLKLSVTTTPAFRCTPPANASSKEDGEVREVSSTFDGRQCPMGSLTGTFNSNCSINSELTREVYAVTASLDNSSTSKNSMSPEISSVDACGVSPPTQRLPGFIWLKCPVVLKGFKV